MHLQSLSFVFYAYVNLEAGKMSTRKGTSIPMISVYEKLKEKSLGLNPEHSLPLL